MPSQVQNNATQFTESRFHKNPSWVKMMIEEEEETLREKENMLKNILAARRFLYSIGQYELEEGEILE